MKVIDILLNALANANHIHGGNSADADDLVLAERLFNTELRYYSSRNLVTAFQKVVDVPSAKTEQVIGGYTLKRGKRVTEVMDEDSKPSASRLVPGRDICHVKDVDRYYEVKESGDDRVRDWYPCSIESQCDFFPDVLCGDMERVVSAMFMNSYGQWESLRFTPLSLFYTEQDDYVFCTSAAGENKVRLLLPPTMVGKDVRLVYNSEMYFDKRDEIDLPDGHIALMEIALTVAILRQDSETDPTRINNYKEQLAMITSNIESTTVSERRIQRPSDGVVDHIRSGSFIFRR